MLSNWTGFLLVVSAGLCWIGIGISVSICARRGWNYDFVQGLNYFGAALVCGVLLACHAWPSASSSKILALVFLMNSLAGIANFYTYVLTAKAMRIGPNGLIWGIMQAGMIGSTLMGICFFGEHATLPRLAGLLLIVGGVFAMGLGRDRQSGTGGGRWLVPSLGAFCLVMLTHCCNTLPSFFPETAGTGSIFRAFGMYSGGVIGFATFTLPGLIRKRECGGKGEWISAVILMVLNTAASCFLFYKGLDLLAGSGAGGLGYPVAIGVCVAGFSLYSLLFLKEKFARLSLGGLIAVCLGIIIITLK